MSVLHSVERISTTDQGILVLLLHGLGDLPHDEGEAAEPQETMESPPPLQPG
jgi:hypothetical protein